MRVFTEKYLNNKKKFDDRAKLFGYTIEPVDMNGGFVPLNKLSPTNLEITEDNIQDRFDLESVDCDEDD